MGARSAERVVPPIKHAASDAIWGRAYSAADASTSGRSSNATSPRLDDNDSAIVLLSDETASSDAAPLVPHNALKLAFCGGVSGALAKTCTAPLARLTILYQVRALTVRGAAASGQQLGLVAALRHITATEGIRSLWKGNLVTIMHRIPYSATNFWTYESTKRALKGRLPNEASIAWTAGAASGLVACTAAYPLDLLRTRFAAETCSSGQPQHYCHVPSALRHIVAEQGVRGLYKGLSATLLQVVPGLAFNFCFYDSFKSIAMRHQLAALASASSENSSSSGSGTVSGKSGSASGAHAAGDGAASAGAVQQQQHPHLQQQKKQYPQGGCEEMGEDHWIMEQVGQELQQLMSQRNDHQLDVHHHQQHNHQQQQGEEGCSGAYAGGCGGAAAEGSGWRSSSGDFLSGSNSGCSSSYGVGGNGCTGGVESSPYRQTAVAAAGLGAAAAASSTAASATAASLSPSALTSAVCACASGLCTSTLTFPLDVVRRRLQVYERGPLGRLRYIDVVRTVYAEGGLRAFYRGIGPEYAKVLPGMAIAFTTYEALKRLTGAA